MIARGLLVAAALAVASPAGADTIARQGSDWVRLTLRPCADPAVVAVLEAHGEHADAFRAAVAYFGGHEFAGCWRPVGGGAGIVYGDGDAGYVPAQDLAPVPET